MPVALRCLKLFYLLFPSKFFHIFPFLSHSKTARHCFQPCYLRLQFLKPIFFISVHSESHYLNLGFPTRRELCFLRTVSLLQGSSSCILKSSPNHLKLPIFIKFTMSRSPHSLWFSLLYLIFYIKLSLIGNRIILLSWIQSVFPSFIKRGQHSFNCRSFKGFILHIFSLIFHFLWFSYFWNP